ncbi:hypothetical protein GS501_04625 [Saccharibacter sp. 17.LH.SD]|uniref:hypothetical protein n=1 Tax=Saccharibacter sp. 17.LH.SD TaxID=2689393 RepID=UPI00136F0303|nr:hypothetical protein [Saccharibacter sp. 17.LH.SD]MXV44330.1 hypothetical protein [Saccharibacter sp. 17.LH.SD]
MVNTLSINPYATTQASGLFSSSTTGAIQGLSWADPATRYRLSIGYVDPSETLPLWGGIAISERIGQLPGMGATVNEGRSPNNGRMGNALKRATSNSDMTGFAVFDHANHMVITPSSPVPQSFPGMSIGFVRFGSDTRLPVQADPALLSQVGNLTSGSYGWDFSQQRLVAGSSANTIPVRLLDVFQTGGKLVTIDQATGAARWQRSEDIKDSILVLIQF